MACQMEDVLNCLKILYPQFQVHFLFDHSCGHDRQREDGLNANRMNKEFGGAQQRMHSTKMKTQHYLGPHQGILRVGDVQHMSYGIADLGPFYLSPEERAARKFDHPTGEIRTKQKTKAELLAELDASGIGNTRGKTKVELQVLATAHGIALSYAQPVVQEGWAYKAKGLLQVLWERGFIDTINQDPSTYYTVEGQKDAMGNTIPGTSLRELMLQQPDFVEEETLLQFHGRLLGTTIDWTPKCHPEFAGEGIEYAW